jgi:transposase-like protein
MAGSRRQFSREFKVEAVRQVLDGGRPLARVARELDISQVYFAVGSRSLKRAPPRRSLATVV